jgi:hypothetical protein
MESVVGFLEHVGGHTHDIIYDLLFTENRVIALIVEHPADVPCRLNVTELLLGSQLGKRSEWTERKRIAEERRRAYKQMPIDKLVTMDSRNFDILFNAVASVEINRSLLRSHLRFTISRPGAREVAIRFTLPNKSVLLAHDLIEQVLPAKIKKRR